MRIVSWNVNGIRAVVKKGFIDQISQELNDPDIICLQETKAQNDQINEALSNLSGYEVFSSDAEKKGYSGVAILTKQKPKEVVEGIGLVEHDKEGRVLRATYEDFHIVTVYTPNSKSGLERLPYRGEWDELFNNYLQDLRKSKPVIVCGDFNVAHQEIDIARPKANYNKSAGYTQQEIDGFSRFTANGLVDSFRKLHPEEVKYSWWSFRAGARGKNIGWRLDYFLVDENLMDSIDDAYIQDEVMGSDHCPVGILLK